jgi:metal-responsive CopG/Arc/MetJ family transcriptional regulator
LTVESKRVSPEYGKAVSVAISVPEKILDQVEKHRRFENRSRYIVRAIDHYIREEEEFQNDSDDN